MKQVNSNFDSIKHKLPVTSIGSIEKHTEIVKILINFNNK